MSLLMGRVCVGSCCGGGLSVVGGQCGDSSWTCVRASMISFGAALNFA